MPLRSYSYAGHSSVFKLKKKSVFILILLHKKASLKVHESQKYWVLDLLKCFSFFKKTTSFSLKRSLPEVSETYFTSGRLAI